MRPRESVRECRATILDQILTGNSSTAGLLIRKAPRSSHHGSGSLGIKASPRFEAPRRRDRGLGRTWEGDRLSPGAAASACSGIVLATRVPDPRGALNTSRIAVLRTLE